MRRITAAVVLLVAGAMARADCVSTSKPVSIPAVFPNHVAGPLAWSGAVLGVAKTDAGDQNANPIFFATYDGDLAQLTNDRKVADSTLSGAVALFWTGSEFGLFYQTQGRQLTLQRIDANANPIGAPIAITNHTWSPEDEFDVTWVTARGAYAVAHNVTLGPDAGLWATLLSPTGSVLSDANITVFSSAPSTPRVVGLPAGNVGLVWSRSDPPLLFLSLITPGTVAFKNVVISRDHLVNAPRLATNGSQILIVYATPSGGGVTELRSAIADLGGNIVSADATLMTGSGNDILPLQLLWNPLLSEWALTYIDAPLGLTVFQGDIRLRRFASLSSTPSDTFFSPNALQSRLNAPYPIVFANLGYTGSIQRVLSRAEGSESYLVRNCPFIATASVDRPISQPSSPITFTATPSGGAPPFMFEWDFGDLSRQTGAVVQHVYTRPGTYIVTLTSTDASGARSISTLTVQVVFLRRRAVR